LKEPSSLARSLIGAAALENLRRVASAVRAIRTQSACNDQNVRRPQYGFHNIKQAYKFRNAVVHASSRTIRIKDEQGNLIELEQFLGTFQAYTHRALRLMIEQAASVDVNEPLFDWNTLV
jgi:hypothetical protein